MQDRTVNIVHAGQPSRTALGAATMRAAHQLLDDPLVFNDPFALRILGKTAEAELRADPFGSNSLFLRPHRASFAIRARLAEDELALGVEAGVRQYVPLGAGLDTLAYRNPHPGVKVFEVDHPATQEWKRQLLRAADIPLPRDLVFVPLDFERKTLRDGLTEAGFAFDRPACVSWLGVIMYLTEAAALECLTFIASLPKHSSITFDFIVPPETIQDPLIRAMKTRAKQSAGEMGEPLLCEFEPPRLRELLRDVGFNDVHVYGPDDLNRRYLHRRKDGLQTNGYMACARV
jgi:methyltransferase (TIGR00027 family)